MILVFGWLIIRHHGQFQADQRFNPARLVSLRCRVPQVFQNAAVPDSHGHEKNAFVDYGHIWATDLWGFPQLGVPQTGRLRNGTSLVRWMIEGVPPFQETSRYIICHLPASKGESAGNLLF